MQSFPPTNVLRHRRENLKKCSLRGLESRSDFAFSTYPTSRLPSLAGYLMLSFDGPVISISDAEHGLFVIDATWRYAEKMVSFVGAHAKLERRSIPKEFRTAYPRRQEDCPFPDQGLASIEAIYVAYYLMGRDTTGLLEGYHWKNAFLEINRELLVV